MHQKLNKLKSLVVIAVLAQALVLLLYSIGLGQNVTPACLVLLIECAVFLYSCDRYNNLWEENSSGISHFVGDASAQALLFGEVGMLTYDDSYVIVNLSELFEKRLINVCGQKVLSWLPEVDPLISGGADSVTAEIEGRTYQIRRKSDQPVLIFKDVTELDSITHSYEAERSVIGMGSFDNYDESTQFEDDAAVSAINVAVRMPFIEYCKEHGILIKRVNNSSYMMVLNERIYNELYNDRFSVQNVVRKAAQKLDVSITLSMAFARGNESFEEADDMVSNLMDLAQSRGGDQVAVQKAGEDVKYYGGSSEAAEKRSRVRVRVMAHTFRELVARSSNVVICGHKNMDFDCAGSAIGVLRICEALHKPASIIGKTGGVEEKLKAVLEKKADKLQESGIRFVTEAEAINQLQDKTLVVMVDHHNIRNSNGSKVLESAKKIAVIDHHRRSTEMGVSPIFVYIEAGASSASELVTEMVPYISNRIEITPLDATIMLAGITIDTGRFHVRTGARTFDACSSLRRLGGDPQEVDEYLRSNYSEFASKSAMCAAAERYDHNIIITPYGEHEESRSLLSQVADELLAIREVDAVFVIANDRDGQTCISARSNGKVNVQVIMEHMNGGGHMTAAALQRPRCNIKDLKEELVANINQYFEEGENDESNPEK